MKRLSRRKRLTYRDLGGASREAHQEHWRGFTFEAGPVMVAYIGYWGRPQVWAASETEGRRVITHACSIANIPIDGPYAGEWVVTTAKDGRNGQPGTFAVPTAYGFPMVLKRIGPSGPAVLGDL
jgi:hypothetical protein